LRLPDREESLHAQFHKPTERRSFHFATHHEHHLIGEFNVGLEAQVTARRTLKHEAKVDMYDMTLSIYHDIAIVTVFDLEEVGYHAVRCHRLDKVATNILKLFGRLVSVLRDEILIHVAVCCTSKLIP